GCAECVTRSAGWEGGKRCVVFRARQLRLIAGIFRAARLVMPFSRSFLLRLLPPLALAAGGALLHALLLPVELKSVENQLTGFPDSDVSAHLARPVILAMLCYLPALGALAYALGNTLDRYVTRLFLGIFGICLSALLVIWLLIDL